MSGNPVLESSLTDECDARKFLFPLWFRDKRGAKAMRKDAPFGLLVLSFWFGGPASAASSPAELEACARLVEGGFRPIAEDRADRFLRKVTKDAALCRGGEKAVRFPG